MDDKVKNVHLRANFRFLGRGEIREVEMDLNVKFDLVPLFPSVCDVAPVSCSNVNVAE